MRDGEDGANLTVDSLRGRARHDRAIWDPAGPDTRKNVRGVRAAEDESTTPLSLRARLGLCLCVPMPGLFFIRWLTEWPLNAPHPLQSEKLCDRLSVTLGGMTKPR